MVWALSYPARVMEDAYEIREGDCREVMRGMDAESIDAIVCDPPYGLSFMGKGWDHGVPGVEFWTEAMRVAKPGAHLLAFGGTRTYHRLACAIEDAGWEIRDCVMWVYGSGFPKSHDVSKAIDKMDAAQEQAARRYRFTDWVRSTGVTARQIDDALGTHTMGRHYTDVPPNGKQPAIMTREHLEACRHLLGEVPEWVEREADIRSVESKTFAEREVVGQRTTGIGTGNGATPIMGDGNRNITAPATDAARQWSGWGTALKPAWEPIIVARKPLVGTVAENVIAHGTGAINVDGCRVGEPLSYASGAFPERTNRPSRNGRQEPNGRAWARSGDGVECREVAGRWPANVMHDGSEQATAPMGESARFFYCAKASKADRDEGCEGLEAKTNDWQRPTSGLSQGKNPATGERSGVTMQPRTNHHPTVKPTALMRYLCRLVTQPGGIVLDPFCGSGSTGKAARLEGFRFIGIERESDYAAIARARIAAVESLHE
jgi:DNA modification methylase